MGSTFEEDLLKNHNIESPSNHYHFALTGNVFSVIKTYYPDLLSKILVRGTVFARMSPEQKQQLVEYLQALGYFVGKFRILLIQKKHLDDDVFNVESGL